MTVYGGIRKQEVENVVIMVTRSAIKERIVNNINVVIE